MAIALDLGTIGDINDYTSLVEKAKLWLDRGSELDALMPTFVANVEAHLNRLLRTPDMEAFALISATNGAVSLPLDCLQVRGLKAAGRPLENTSPADLAERFMIGSGGYATGCALGYSITGRQVQIAPISAEPLSLTYWQRLPALSINQPSNWLLDAHADIYLFGTLFQANTYIVDAEAASAWSVLFDNAVAALQDAGTRARFGGPIIARTSVRQLGGVRA